MLHTNFAARLSAALLFMGLALAGCGQGSDPAAEAVVDREIFIATYVDLRVTALTRGGDLTDEQRTAVLDRHGVAEADLVSFAEVHGTDLTFMRDVWNDVEARLDAARTTSDSLALPGAP